MSATFEAICSVPTMKTCSLLIDLETTMIYFHYNYIKRCLQNISSPNDTL